MKIVLYLQRVKKLFTFSPSFHHPINDDIVVLRVGESPRVGEVGGHSPMKGPRMKG